MAGRTKSAPSGHEVVDGEAVLATYAARLKRQPLATRACDASWPGSWLATLDLGDLECNWRFPHAMPGCPAGSHARSAGSRGRRDRR